MAQHLHTPQCNRSRRSIFILYFRPSLAQHMSKPPDASISSLSLGEEEEEQCISINRNYCTTVTSKIIKQIRKFFKCSRMLEWVRDNPLCFGLFIYLFILFFSPVKSISHAYIAYSEVLIQGSSCKMHKERKKYEEGATWGQREKGNTQTKV